MSNPLDDYLKVLNATGFFFQMRVAHEVRQTFDNVREELPLEYGERSSKLDVLAEVSRGPLRVFIFIETKRHAHDFNSWIFFSPMSKSEFPYILGFGQFPKSIIVDRFYASSAATKSGQALDLSLLSYPFRGLGPLDIGYIGIEVKLSGRKHRMEELTGVSKDVVTATHGMALEIEKRALKDEASREESVLFIPVVITTAKLFIARADVSKVALKDGKLETKGLELRPLPWLVYQYALTTDLLLPVNTGSQRWNSLREDNLRRRDILVVNSDSLTDFLHKLKQDIGPAR
jgi:hypothetical protein